MDSRGRLSMSMFTLRQKNLLNWAIAKHSGQVRKYTGEPYWHHLLNVALIVEEHEIEPFGVEIALLHDILEDTSTSTLQLIAALHRIGYTEREINVIQIIVDDLTNKYNVKCYPNLNRKERKELERGRFARASPLAQSVKYADILDNVGSIVKHDPEFAKVYLREKLQLLRVAGLGDQVLYKKALTLVQSARIELKAKYR